MTRGRKNSLAASGKQKKENSQTATSATQQTLRSNAKKQPIRPTLCVEDEKKNIKIKPLELATGNKESPSTTAKTGKSPSKSVPGTVRKKASETVKGNTLAAFSLSPSRSVREPTQSSTARVVVSKVKHPSLSPTMKKTNIAKLNNGEHTFVPKAITRRDVEEVRTLLFDGSTPTRLFDPLRAKKRPFMRQKLPSAQEFESAENYENYIERMKVTRIEKDILEIDSRSLFESAQMTPASKLSEAFSKMHITNTSPSKAPRLTSLAVLETMQGHRNDSRRDESKTFEELMDEITPELKLLFAGSTSPNRFPSPIDKVGIDNQSDDCLNDWMYDDKRLESLSPIGLPLSPLNIPLPHSPEPEKLPDIRHGEDFLLGNDPSQQCRATTPVSNQVNLSRSFSVVPQPLLKEESDSPSHADRESGCESKVKVGELLARRERGRRRGRTESSDVLMPSKIDPAVLACGRRRRAGTASASNQQARSEHALMSSGRVVSNGSPNTYKDISSSFNTNRRNIMKRASVDSRAGYVHLTSDGSDGENPSKGLAANLKDFTKTIIKMKKGDRAVIEQFLEALRNVESETNDCVWKAAASKESKAATHENNPYRNLNPEAPAFRNLFNLKDEVRRKRFYSAGQNSALSERSLQEINNDQNVPLWTGFRRRDRHLPYGYAPSTQNKEPIWMKTSDVLLGQLEPNENYQHSEGDLIWNYARWVPIKQENTKKGAVKRLWDERLIPLMPIHSIPPPQPMNCIKPDPEELARLVEYRDKLLASSVIIRQFEDRMVSGREAKTLDQAWADQLLFNFKAKYPLTGTQAPSSPLEELRNESDDSSEAGCAKETPKISTNGKENEFPVRKSWWEKKREATLVQQKLEQLLQLKKDKAAMEEMAKNPSIYAKPLKK